VRTFLLAFGGQYPPRASQILPIINTPADPNHSVMSHLWETQLLETPRFYVDLNQ
jgi:hypothetical protein